MALMKVHFTSPQRSRTRLALGFPWKPGQGGHPGLALGVSPPAHETCRFLLTVCHPPVVTEVMVAGSIMGPADTL